MSRFALVLIAALFALMANPALASNWKRVESTNFTVYSDGGSEANLSRFVQSLEVFDSVLRSQFDVAPTPNARKLPIYLMGSQRDLARIDPAISADYAGAYYPELEGAFAVAVRDGGQDYLRHEYFHHFSFQHDNGKRYPGWLAEGMAEYFMTARIDGNSVEIGHANTARARNLARGRWISLETLLTTRPADLTDARSRDGYYPLAWLLTHWFMSDDTRRAQLKAYIDADDRRSNPVAAMTRVTGLSMEQLTAQLQAYSRSPMKIVRHTATGADTQVRVVSMTAVEGETALLAQKMKLDLNREHAGAALAHARQLAAANPTNMAAQLQLAQAETRFGTASAGEAALAAVLAAEPTNVEALQLSATRQQLAARTNAARKDELLAGAHAALTLALEAAPSDAYTLYLLARNGNASGDPMAAWAAALESAPQIDAIRLGFGEALIRSGRAAEAVAVVADLADAPHASAGAIAARNIITRANRMR